PYKFSKWETGREIVLERNPDYWGKKPNLDKIVFKIINDPNVAFQVLRKGELDFAGLTPIQWEKQSKTKKFKEKFNKHAFFRPNYSYIGWNLDRPFFSEKKVRKAMTHLVNRELILEKIL
ncbi:MAG: peptide-binding protein, partial [Candidatus Dadabacteria bacterium]|nr:peptide-binding protein [Candidatus Dadabacteria bacterium]NIT12809.1 peptide-binding protein [Candidatus Dadabacteria bacterium]